MEGGTRLRKYEDGLYLVCDDCESHTHVGAEAHNEEKKECRICGQVWKVEFRRDFGTREYTVFGVFTPEQERIYITELIAEDPDNALELVRDDDYPLDERAQWTLDEADEFIVMRTGEMTHIENE